VIGIAALGVVLYARIHSIVTQALPSSDAAARLRLVQDIAAGRLSSVTLPGSDAITLHTLAVASFAGGYQALFLCAAAFMALATWLTWRLVNPAETPPVGIPAGQIKSTTT
jgi:hypothetical protein